MTVRRACSATLIMLALVLPAPAHAGPIAEQLTADIGRIFSVLAEPGQERGSSGKRRAVRSISEGLFDWIEMARLALGEHWDKRTDAERSDFVRLLPGLVDAHIIALERYTGATIDYVGESVEGERATVKTRVFTHRGRPVSIDYRMLHHEDRWLIYDVVMDNVSLVRNYREQFSSIIRTSSYEKLIEKLVLQ
jgi:phospholipid transport system substrate-binding protein